MIPSNVTGVLLSSNRRDFVTHTIFAFLAEAGADVIVAHAGLTTKGTIGARTALTLDQAVSLVQSIRDVAVSVNPQAEPDDVVYVLSRTRGIAGFFGASSVERLPAERAITEQVQKFKSLRLKE